MGMYTELVLKLDCVDALPAEAQEVLEYLFGEGELPNTLPSHAFFHTTRWDNIGNMSSYYHIPVRVSVYTEGYLFSRSDLKNYDNEIDLFVDWLSQYYEGTYRMVIGWKWCEEDDEPTLLYVGTEV